MPVPAPAHQVDVNPRDAAHGLLQNRIIDLAGAPDDSPRIGTDLIMVAQLAARLITPVGHASVTTPGGDGWATVAASGDVAVTLDHAQYRDGAGPCLDAVGAGRPVAVPDVVATARWPRFRDAAVRTAVHTSLSVPLFAGSGTTIASLNLYGHEPGALTPLTVAVRAILDPHAAGTWDRCALDPGGRELAAGLIAAQALRGMLGRALDVLAVTGDDAWSRLRRQAARAGTSLPEAAADVIRRQPPELRSVTDGVVPYAAR